MDYHSSISTAVLDSEDHAIDSKTKLSNILNSFTEFDQSMKTGARRRLEKEELRIQTVQEELKRLDDALSAEVNRRVELNQNLKSWAETEIAKFSQKLLNTISDRNLAIQGRIDLISSSITSLESRFDDEMSKIPSDIERRTKELIQLLVSFEEKFEAEKRSRLEREGNIIRKLSDHEQAVDRDMNDTRTIRESMQAELRRAIDEHVHRRMKGDDCFRAMVSQEFSSIKNSLEEERITRAREDDEIVEALNRYTSKLQISLRALSSMDK